MSMSWINGLGFLCMVDKPLLGDTFPEDMGTTFLSGLPSCETLKLVSIDDELENCIPIFPGSSAAEHSRFPASSLLSTVASEEDCAMWYPMWSCCFSVSWDGSSWMFLWCRKMSPRPSTIGLLWFEGLLQNPISLSRRARSPARRVSHAMIFSTLYLVILKLVTALMPRNFIAAMS